MLYLAHHFFLKRSLDGLIINMIFRNENAPLRIGMGISSMKIDVCKFYTAMLLDRDWETL